MTDPTDPGYSHSHYYPVSGGTGQGSGSKQKGGAGGKYGANEGKGVSHGSIPFNFQAGPSFTNFSDPFYPSEKISSKASDKGTREINTEIPSELTSQLAGAPHYDSKKNYEKHEKTGYKQRNEKFDHNRKDNRYNKRGKRVNQPHSRGERQQTEEFESVEDPSIYEHSVVQHPMAKVPPQHVAQAGSHQQPTKRHDQREKGQRDNRREEKSSEIDLKKEEIHAKLRNVPYYSHEVAPTVITGDQDRRLQQRVLLQECSPRI